MREKRTRSNAPKMTRYPQKGAEESVHNEEGDLIYELGYENEVGIISVYPTLLLPVYRGLLPS